MKRLLSDEEALAKANSQPWYDNQAGLVDYINQPKKVFRPQQKPNQVNKAQASERTVTRVEDLNAEQCSVHFAEAIERINSYQSLPPEVKRLMRDSIVRTARYTSALKIRMKQIADPEQLTLLAYVENMRNRVVKNRALHDEINALRSQLDECKSPELLLIRQQKAEIKKLHIKNARDRDLVIHGYFKQLVKSEFGDDEFLSLITEATRRAEKDLALAKGGVK